MSGKQKGIHVRIPIRPTVLGRCCGILTLLAGVSLHGFGMNAPGNDDRQFALNVLHWLSGVLK